jgi:hypothetical protein
VIAQRKLQKNAANIQATLEVKEKVLEKEDDIKEKDQATSEKVDDQSEPVSAGALEDNQDQRKSGVKTERLQTGSKGDDTDSVRISDSKSSLLVNDDDLTLESEEGVSYDLELTPEQQELYEYSGERQGEKQAERKENKHLEALREKHQWLKK